MLAIYAELDRNLTRSVLPAAVRLEDLQKPFGLFVYEGTRHAFHNDTGANYDAVAARDAWSRTTAFFKKYLTSAPRMAGLRRRSVHGRRAANPSEVAGSVRGDGQRDEGLSRNTNSRADHRIGRRCLAQGV